MIVYIRNTKESKRKEGREKEPQKHSETNNWAQKDHRNQIQKCNTIYKFFKKKFKLGINLKYIYRKYIPKIINANQRNKEDLNT